MRTEIWLPLASGVVGALITGTLGLIGIILVTRSNRAADKERWQREQRIEAYSQLTATSQKILMNKAIGDDEIRSELYAAFFKTMMLAGDDVLHAGRDLLEATQAPADQETKPERAANAMANFIKQARAELGVAPKPTIQLVPKGDSE